MRDVNLSPSANAIRRMFDLSSMTQKFHTRLSIAPLTELRLSLFFFYYDRLIKFSFARNFSDAKQRDRARINFGFLILIISWRPRSIYIEKQALYKSCSSSLLSYLSRSMILQEGFDLSVRTRRRKKIANKAAYVTRMADIDRDVIHQCVGIPLLQRLLRVM